MAEKSRRGNTARKLEQSGNEGELLRFVEDLKRQWMLTIDALVDPLIIISGDYAIQKANLAMARLSNSDVKDIIGRKCFQVFAGRDSPCPGCTLKSTMKATKPSTFELDQVRNDRIFEVTSQPLLDAEGKPEGVVHVYRDRTVAKKMQSQLSQQDKLASIGLLAGGVAHEINNPLGGILIFSQMLLREMDTQSPHYQDVVEIEAATQRCKAIVEGLLDFARQNPVDQKIIQTEINAIEAIQAAVRFGSVGFKNGGKIRLSTQFDGKEHNLVGDRNRIIQVFLNLIQNAAQAMPDGGSLTIRSMTRQDSAGKVTGVYEVEDTGVGIPPEYMDRIFDPFFTTKDPGEGTGLGLALCYGIIKDLNGRMRVSSTVNVGTCFTIEIPLKSVKKAKS
ncbi:MAG: ATP-binding protein [Proteobacteria bacterium]|nr:ATP-binding protein [Pseudomonadota bacterium]